MRNRREPAGPEAAALEGLDAIEAAQVRRCARVLLRRPLLRADGPDGDALPAVRRYADRLRSLFAGYLGYRLAVEPGFARLYKSGGAPDGQRGAHKATGAPFTPRAYAYLALVLASLTGSGGQVLLSGLVGEVRAAGAEAGLRLGTGIVDRRALVAALRHLIGLGVLAETDGSVAPWADDAGREALLTVDVELLGHLVAAPGRTGTGEGHRGAEDERHRLRRRIVEDPVVLAADLTDGQRELLRTRARAEAELLEDLFGLQLEVRAQGVLAVDPEGYLTDRHFPGHGTVARIALLAAAELSAEGGGAADGGGAGAEDAEDGRIRVGAAQLREVATGIAARYPRAWSKEAVRDPERLAEAVAGELARAGLARPDADGLRLSPAAARYRPRPDGDPEPEADGPDTGSEPPPPEPHAGQESLFAAFSPAGPATGEQPSGTGASAADGPGEHAAGPGERRPDSSAGDGHADLFTPPPGAGTRAPSNRLSDPPAGAAGSVSAPGPGAGPPEPEP
ncbi:TIGR02678 family protein [Nocardiopsis coralliicola]